MPHDDKIGWSGDDEETTQVVKLTLSIKCLLNAGLDVLVSEVAGEFISKSSF